MISVVIIGSGNVASHLIKAFLAADTVALKQVFTRNTTDIEQLKHRVATINSFELLENVDVTIIAVPDDAIAAVSAEIDNSLVVHTSGTKPMSELNNNTRKGVFYPLQSFSKGQPVDFTTIPFCLEAETNQDLALLEQLTESLGAQSYQIDSEQRKYMHLAAVFANNFSNHMYRMAANICEQHKIPFEVLAPLIQETATKIKDMHPKDAQTGPAIRNDEQTIKKQLDLLDEEQQEIYQLLTQSIQKHGKKL